ncbi:hypothetical protein [Microcoleus sp. POL10_C6]|uniref:hypothetical protein n=1 Tax=Microcoleus sp. POL10_C6 TaxID=2818852 RepID=UPI002FCF8D86
MGLPECKTTIAYSIVLTHDYRSIASESRQEQERDNQPSDSSIDVNYSNRQGG